MLIMENVLKISKVCVSPIVLFILALIILLVYVFKAGTNYLNIGKIFKDYISIFSDAKKHLWIFWGVPVLLSCALVQVTMLTSGLAENLCVFLSILVSAFFAMLSILVSKDATKQASKLYEQVLKETASTVLLEIVLRKAPIRKTYCQYRKEIAQTTNAGVSLLSSMYSTILRSSSANLKRTLIFPFS